MAPIERKVGDNAETDETVLALGNMKMENTTMAPGSCRLREIPLGEGGR
jgi:biotin carboxyl carrier protein